MNDNFINDLEQNYELKEELVDKLRGLTKNTNSISKNYSEFSKIKQKWFEIGPVPRQKNQILWNNFQHHIKNFYDYLNLDRTLKKIDEKYNFEEKKRIIDQVKNLSVSDNIFYSEKTLNRLLKKWKYETGPISKHYEKIEDELKEATKDIRKKIELFNKTKENLFNENLEKKVQLLKSLKSVLNNNSKTSFEWKKKINDFEKIKKKIQLIGPISPKQNKTFWKELRKYNLEFYKEKNIYFKEQKKLYKKNIERQKKIIADVKLNIRENDYSKEKLIILQKEWKKTKPIPFIINKKNYTHFKNLCDQIFKKINAKKLIENEENINEIKLQMNYIENIEKSIKKGKFNLDKTFDRWNEFSKKHIESERKFFDTIKIYLQKEGLKENEIEVKIFDQKIKRMSDNEKKIKKIILNKKLEDFQKELLKLENNFSFFNDKSKEKSLLNNIKDDLNSIREKIIILNFKISKLTN